MIIGWYRWKTRKGIVNEYERTCSMIVAHLFKSCSHRVSTLTVPHKIVNNIKKYTRAYAQACFKSYPSNTLATASLSESSWNGGCWQIFVACGMESVIQKVERSSSGLVNFCQESCGKTAWLTYILILAAPRALSAWKITNEILDCQHERTQFELRVLRTNML